MAAIVGEERYVFETDWYDQVASIIRKYRVTYYPGDKTIEMYDAKNKKVFLKRCPYPGVSMDDLHIGSVITVYARQLKIVDYGDVATRKKFEVNRQRTFAMIKPDGYNNIGKIIDAVYANGFKISKLKMSRFTEKTAGEFYAEHKEKPFYPNLTQFMKSDVVVGMELVKDNAITTWRELIGPTDSNQARREAPTTLRAIFGTDTTKDAVHGSDSPAAMARETEFWFGGQSVMKSTALLNNCTLCIIKPHIIIDGQAGQVIDWILSEGFEISAMEMFYLTLPTAEELFDVYKGVLPEYVPLIEHLTSGPCIALEIRQENVVGAFRQFAGPHDPEIAKHLRPNTIRAKFGIDRVKNAVHITDLSEDGVLECEYFFNILQDNQ